MFLKDMSIGEFVTRKDWQNSAQHPLYIGREQKDFMYYKNNKPGNKVNVYSSVWKYDDFIYCDRHGNIPQKYFLYIGSTHLFILDNEKCKGYCQNKFDPVNFRSLIFKPIDCTDTLIKGIPLIGTFSTEQELIDLLNPYKNTTQKETQMSYEDIKIIVTSSKGDIMPFKSEDDAIAWIAEKLEAAPRLNFTMFKGYQAVEPTKPDLSKFIRKIED